MCQGLTTIRGVAIVAVLWHTALFGSEHAEAPGSTRRKRYCGVKGPGGSAGSPIPTEEVRPAITPQKS